MLIRPGTLMSSSVATGEGGSAAFDPASLFGASEVGAVINIADTSTLFEERTGASASTPSSVDGVVGTIVDVSGNGHYFTAPSDAARGILRQSGALYYLEVDGTDDWYKPVSAIDLNETWSNVIAWASTGVSGKFGWTGGTDSKASVRELSGKWIFHNSSGVATNLHTAGTLTDPHVLTIERDGLTSIAGRFNGANGASFVPFNTSTFTNDVALFTAVTGSYGNGIAGDFYGGLWINRLITSDERSDLESYFAALAGVSL